MASWNFVKEAVRALKGQMSKNARNTAKYQKKKERGPVKAFFHITKNENVPAIEQQGLLTNHPNANINSANHPFRKHGTDAGGVWITTEPTAFPVYGTTIGGKNGNASARADALSTIKIEVPLPELRKMRAVQDPYGVNILRKGDDPRAIEKFGTWAGIDVPTTVLLNDVKPQWLKNIGYVEEAVPSIKLPITDHLFDIQGSWALPTYNNNIYRSLNKADIHALSGETGHRHGTGSYEKSPYRFVEDYLNRNRPIIDRLPVFPKPDPIEIIARRQGAYSGPKYVRDGMAEVPAPNEVNRYSWGFIPAQSWIESYQDYVKPGELIDNRRRFIQFAPGAISRGMGGGRMPSVKDRNFNWNTYKKLLEEGDTPQMATFNAQPLAKLDWDNIVYRAGVYEPEKMSAHDFDALSEGAVSRGLDRDNETVARMNRIARRKSAERIRREKNESRKYLSRGLGRQPTTEEIDHWARAGIWNDIEVGDIPDAPRVLNMWADKTNWDIVENLSAELFKRSHNK